MNRTIDRYSDKQIKNIIDRLVPVIAAPPDYEVFRFILTEAAKSGTPAEFNSFVSELLKNYTIPTKG